MDKSKNTGFLVKESFPELMDKWSFQTEVLTCEVIESIGGDIDLVFIDTMHITPGEMLDWLMILPFLKEEAIVAFHDTFWMFRVKEKKNYSNNQILNYIRGELILPNHGNELFSTNIGALKLDKDQKKYYINYFLALGNYWEYMPDNNDLQKMRDFYMKFYGIEYVKIFDDSVNKNKNLKH